MSRFIVDASVALCWYFEDQKTAYTESVFDCLGKGDTALVPAIWPLEVVNSFLVAVRQKTISPAQLEIFTRDLEDLPVEVDIEGVRRVYSSIVRLSQHHQLSSYDAAYLDLASVESLPLATLDKNLRAAAKRVGVELLRFPNR
ncbi:MAG TPA: type II toxin-antitoxin system VapC family toxin [Candidatus Sulfotelmatobacter sp.]|nr:type II toxin-antitoxin system VapC family toxin [Candidatus Sulfotelmatobacter sp.]